MVKLGFETEEVEEGKVRIIVPKAVRGKGPGKKEGFPFYNPVMEVNRDISVLVVQNWVRNEKRRLLDGLAGTGIRGIRLAAEVEGEHSIVMNDWNELCYELMLKNVEKNDIRNADVKQEDLNELLAENTFNYVDVDPFGTPVYFLKSALSGVEDGGVLAVTATDTAALAGSYPSACQRKYEAQPLQVPARHEIGLRILIGFCARSAAESGLGIGPMLSHSTDHYYRTYLEIKQGDNEARRSLSQIGYYTRDPSTLEAGLASEKDENLQAAGPLWIGEMWEPDFLRGIRPRTYMSSKTSKILELIKDEANTRNAFCSSDEIASNSRVRTPSTARVVDALKEQGYSASLTHFDPKGFRTDAPMERIKQVFESF